MSDRLNSAVNISKAPAEGVGVDALPENTVDSARTVSRSTYDAGVSGPAVEAGTSGGLDNVVDSTKAAAGHLVDQAQDHARDMVDAQKRGVAQGFRSAANALRQGSTNLQTQNEPMVGRYFESAATQIDRFAGQIDQTSVDELASEAAAWARSQPVLFVGGAFLVGFLAARFLKSSSEQAARTTPRLQSNGGANQDLRFSGTL
jgi:hypothetical protein